MIVKRITYFDQPATVACDGNCSKAWGMNSRPKVLVQTPGYRGDPQDDYAYLADSELGEAPVDPGTYEGGQAKPIDAKGPNDINKWCVRECERNEMTHPGKSHEVPELPDFSVRVYNVYPRRRDS